MLIKKESNKRRKLYHFEQFREEFDYFHFDRIRTKSETGDVFKGYVYALDNPNMELLINVATKYGNTKIMSWQLKWAPEKKHVCLFIAD